MEVNLLDQTPDSHGGERATSKRTSATTKDQTLVLFEKEDVLTLSSPREYSASSSGSPGAWMLTDLSPRMLLLRLLGRSLSLLSLKDTAEKKEYQSRLTSCHRRIPLSGVSSVRSCTCTCGTYGTETTCRSTPSIPTRCPCQRLVVGGVSEPFSLQSRHLSPRPRPDGSCDR